MWLTVFALAVANAVSPSSDAPTVYRNRTFAVRVTRNLTYAQGLRCSSSKGSVCSAMNLTFDLYQPASVPARVAGSVGAPTDPPASGRPAYVLVHGGGNTAGNNTYFAMEQSADFFASRGFVVLNINYRLMGDHGLYPHETAQAASEQLREWVPSWTSGYPAVRDLKAAIRYARAQAASLGVDTGRIAVGGGSAGATNSLAAGVTFESDYKSELTAAQDPTLATTNPHQSSAVAAVVSHWASDLEADALPRRYDPQNRTRYSATNAPVIEFHGDKDSAINISHAYAAQRAYARTGVDYELHVLTGCGHTSWCYNGAGTCTCHGNPKVGDASDLMDQMALPFLAKHLRLTLV